MENLKVENKKVEEEEEKVDVIGIGEDVSEKEVAKELYRRLQGNFSVEASYSGNYIEEGDEMQEASDTIEHKMAMLRPKTVRDKVDWHWCDPYDSVGQAVREIAQEICDEIGDELGYSGKVRDEVFEHVSFSVMGRGLGHEEDDTEKDFDKKKVVEEIRSILNSPFIVKPYITAYKSTLRYEQANLWADDVKKRLLNMKDDIATVEYIERHWYPYGYSPSRRPHMLSTHQEAYISELHAAWQIVKATANYVGDAAHGSDRKGCIFEVKKPRKFYNTKKEK